MGKTSRRKEEQQKEMNIMHPLLSRMKGVLPHMTANQIRSMNHGSGISI